MVLRPWGFQNRWKKVIDRSSGPLLPSSQKGHVWKRLRRIISANLKMVKRTGRASAWLEVLRQIYYTPVMWRMLEKGDCPQSSWHTMCWLDSMATPYVHIHTGLAQILRLALTPVVAHIERYCWKKMMKRRCRNSHACYTQINSSSALEACCLRLA